MPSLRCPARGVAPLSEFADSREVKLWLVQYVRAIFAPPFADPLVSDFLIAYRQRTVFSPIGVSRAWSLCRARGQELQLELVARPETVPVETLRLFQTIAEPVLGHLALSRRGEGP
jgi:hypothetical protein